MQKVLVTGATGLIGSHLIVELLNHTDYLVTAMVRSEDSLLKLNAVLQRHNLNPVDHMLVDTADYVEVRDAIADFDIIFHCAAIVALGDEAPEKIVANNVKLTHYVVESVLVSERKPLLVHVSSTAALGAEIYPKMTTEDSVFLNIVGASPYSRSKFLSENEVLRGIKLGIKAVIVQPSVVLGVGAMNGGGIQELFPLAERGIRFSTDGTMGFVDVVDVARAMRLASEMQETWGGRYLLSGHNLLYDDLIRSLNSSFGKSEKLIKVPKWLLKPAIRFVIKGKEKREMAESVYEFLTSKVVYDGSRAALAFNMEYTPINTTTDRLAKEYTQTKLK